MARKYYFQAGSPEFTIIQPNSKCNGYCYGRRRKFGLYRVKFPFQVLLQSGKKRFQGKCHPVIFESLGTLSKKHCQKLYALASVDIAS